MDESINLIEAALNWRELLAIIVVAYAGGGALPKAVHIRLPFTLRGIRAITLFPLVIYEKGAYTECVRAHEMVHVRQARKMGPAVFYVRYLIGMWQNRGNPGSSHALEIAGMKAEWDCMRDLTAS